MKLRSVISGTELKIGSPEPIHVIQSSTRAVPYNQL